MTTGALAARTLDRCLRAAPWSDGTGGFARRFHRLLAGVIATPWMLTTTEDFRSPAATGRRAELGPARQLVHRARAPPHVERRVRRAPFPRGDAPHHGAAGALPSLHRVSRARCAAWREEAAMDVWLTDEQLAKTRSRGAAIVRAADPHPRRVERRVHAVAADRRAAPRRARDRRARRRVQPAARHGPPAVPAERVRPRGVLPRHESSLRSVLCGDAGRGGRSWRRRRAHRPPGASARLRRADPFRARRLHLERHPRSWESGRSAGIRS